MKIGFIGCGNMGGAMIRGILSSGQAVREDLAASDYSEQSRKRIRDEFGITLLSNEEIASSSDLLVLAVKPQVIESVISQIRSLVKDDVLLVSIAPGKSLSWLREQFGRDLKIVRVMPNTPALVGAGMSGVTPNDLVSASEMDTVLSLLRSFGDALPVPEAMLDVVTAISGSSPAYVFLFIEAMADGAVSLGMSRDQAYRFAAQAVLGSAKMLLETGRHPGELKDIVCSPGGTTIEAVRVLEEKGLRSSVMEAVIACARKSKGM